MHRTSVIALLAAIGGMQPREPAQRYQKPKSGAYESNALRFRTNTPSDHAAFMKRVAKRRAKKGYA